MRRFVFIIVFCTLLIAVLFAYTNTIFALDPLPQVTHFPLPSSIPLPSSFPTLIPIDPVINIPDANLRARLHSYTGVPESEDIHKSDLAALEGIIDIDHSNIANLEGIQYCTNITDLEADHNPSLADLPNMTGMTKLEVLNLRTCGFSSWPTGKLPPKLKLLDFSNNNISAFPDPFTDPCSTWKWLRLNNNKLSKFPEWVTALEGLEFLFLSNNSINKIPESIDNMTSLKKLELRESGLDSIPDSICSLVNLEILDVTGNNLYSLPSNIGNHLKELYASNNHIGTLPNSIGADTNLKWLTLRLNRLTHLPSNFDDHTYTFIDIEFNFIDMSSGSSDRHIIDNTPVTDGKSFELQLKPITEIVAMAAADSISLTWQPGENGSSNNIEWKVESYGVYLYDGSLIELATLDASMLEYTHTGLSPQTEYQYRICVNYKISSTSWVSKNRYYTRESTATLEFSAETTEEPSELLPTGNEVSASTSESPSENVDESEDTPANMQTTEPVENTNKAFPVWAIVVISVLGAGIIGTGITVGFMLRAKLKKRKAKEG